MIIMDGLCDVKGCNKATYMGWRPLTERRGRQICEYHWCRHKDEKDSFDLYDEFGIKKKIAALKIKPENPSTAESKTNKQPIKKMAQALSRFLRGECANYDNHYQVCMLTHTKPPKTDRPCCVMEGKRCGYFEQAVLGPPDYSYRLPSYDYAKLFAQYADQTETEAKKVRQRRCDCGAPLTRRQRYCESCRKIRAKAANRERQRKHRFSNSLNVTL